MADEKNDLQKTKAAAKDAQFALSAAIAAKRQRMAGGVSSTSGSLPVTELAKAGANPPGPAAPGASTSTSGAAPAAPKTPSQGGMKAAAAPRPAKPAPAKAQAKRKGAEPANSSHPLVQKWKELPANTRKMATVGVAVIVLLGGLGYCQSAPPTGTAVVRDF